MAADSPDDVASLVVYQVFPRNHGPNGTFADVVADLRRIRDLGVDVLYLMPIHPVGEVGRKGSLGSPFAIRDHRAVDPVLGGDAGFDALLDAAHVAGLRVLIDVVFNHTSPDSPLLASHPHFYHRDAAGEPVSSVPQWTDIIDFARGEEELDRYLIDTLRMWVDRGVDGFRCDSASLTPIAFWLRARAELAKIRPGLLWLAESVHPDLVERRRAAGLNADSDAEVSAAFDLEYTYDVWPIWQAAVVGAVPVGRYLEMIRWEAAELPAHAMKLRHVENHDNFRIRRLAPSPDAADAWTALTAFLPGAFMIQAGQESALEHWTTLFDPDPIAWGDRGLSGFLTRLAGLQKHPALRTGFRVLAADPVPQLAWGVTDRSQVAPPTDGPGLYGVFTTSPADGPVPVQLPDGTYRDLLSDADVVVSDGAIPAPASAVVLVFTRPFTERPWRSNLLDLFLHVEHFGDRRPTAADAY